MSNRSAGRTKKQLVADNADLHARLEEAEATLRAIRSAAGPARTGGAFDDSNLVAADQTEPTHVAHILATRLRLLEFAATHALGELLQATLDELELLTGSQIAFCHFLDVDQQTLLLQAWSSNTRAKMCQAEGAGRHYDVAEAGVWVDCVRERRPVIHNDYAALPHRTGTPAGHAVIVRELVAPVFRHDQIVAILGVGNKPEEYTQHDVEIVVNLADLAWDIAERKRTEEELRYQSTLLENVNDAIVASDAQYRITAWNAAAESLYGWKAEDVLGRIGIEVTRTAWPAADADAMRREIAETGRWRGEATQVRKDGTRFPVEISSIALRDQSGAISGYVSVNRDITEHKQAEQEHERLQMQLAQAQKMETVGRLAGGIAHDFNNMLAVILMRAELALQMADPGTPLHRSLTAIYTTGQRSAELVRQLQGFARKQTITPKVLDLNAALANTLPMLDKLIGEDIELHWRPGAHLWPVKLDPVQIDQIMANLCVNARDAIGDVGVITIETANVVLGDAVAASGLPVTPGDYVMIAVSDTGQGMDRELLSHIFEPFYTTKAAGKGTGLGLATVEGIVQQNQGEICVASEPGAGTTFRIYLPRCNEEMALSGDGQYPRLLQGHGETVLLVEDEVAVVQMAAEALNHLGYTVITATTPSAAIHAAERLPGSAALLITDIIMPEMNGVALAERIAQMQPGIKCLYVSGYPADFVAHRGVLTPDVHFLQKPFSLQDLAMQVRAALGDAG